MLVLNKDELLQLYQLLFQYKSCCAVLFANYNCLKMKETPNMLFLVEMV